MILLAILIVPLAAALIAFTARTRSVMEAANVGAFTWIFILSLKLMGDLTAGPVAIWDGFLYADALSALVLLLTSFVAMACSVYAIGYFRQEQMDEPVKLEDLRRYYSLAPLFVFSMLLVAVANNLGLMWVAIEATTLASVFLIAFYNRATSLEAAWKYAMIGGVGLSMALLGTILTYYSGHTVLGTESLSGLNWSILVTKAAQFDKPTVRLAFMLILLGYGTKAGVAPMHTWKPDAYAEAPVPVAAMLAAGVLNCAFYGLIRFYILTSKCLGPEFASRVLIIFGLLSMGVAVPFILVQRSYRRILAYSSIDHAGIMLLGLGFGGVLGTLGVVLHMTFHSITKPLAFFCAGNIQQHFKSDVFKKVRGGVIHVLPVSGAAFLMAALAVTGTPPFSLFQSEFTILRAGFATGNTVASVVYVVCLVSIFAGFLVHAANLVLGPDPGGEPGDLCPWKKYTVIGTAAIVVAIGFWIPVPIFTLIQSAARVIGGGQ